MTDVEVMYFTDTWNDLTDHVKQFKIEDYGITRLPKATISLLGKETDFTNFLSAPMRLMRIRAKPAAAWMNLFYGYVDNPWHKSIRGTTQDIRRLSLDVGQAAYRLTTDFVTFDYYRLQSALKPLEDTNAWTYRDMLADALLYPDSTRDGSGVSGTPYTIEAATDTEGIDHVIESACAWNQNSLLEMIRITCDRIGYDGYIYLPSEFTYKIKLAKFDKASSLTFSNPYIKEPEYEGGSSHDIGNVIFIWGGIDLGVPADKDRFTEYGYTKYSPAAWSAILSGAGTVGITDENNSTYFTLPELRVNTKCLKVTASNTTEKTLTLKMDFTKTSFSDLNLQERLNRGLYFALRMYCSPSMPTNLRQLYIHLIDTSSDHIWIHHLNTTGKANFSNDDEKHVFISTEEAVENVVHDNPNLPIGYPNIWAYYTGSTSFDWANVKELWIQTKWGNAPTTGHTWGFCIDGLYFEGGHRIQPFQSYSASLNPPAVDMTSINTYGVHVYPHTDNNISSFEHAQAEATRLLANMKNPIPKLVLTKILPTTQLFPSNVVTVSAVDYRIYGIEYEWDTRKKDVHATYKLIGKVSAIPPIWAEEVALRYMIK